MKTAYEQKVNPLKEMTRIAAPVSHRPGPWDAYRQFLQDVYDIEGRIPEIDPPDNVVS